MRVTGIRFTVLAMGLSGAFGGCASFDESHYFVTEDSRSGELVNYFRLTVDGAAYFSSARYVSGCYDERAVDLFFNELRVSSKTEDVNLESLFADELESPGTDTIIKPLDACDGGNGTYVMILSTNAEAVANTIGSFAESEVVADSVINLLNRDRLARAAERAALASGNQRRAAATRAELQGLMEALPAEGTDMGEAETREGLLAILRAISRAVGDPRSFQSLAEAESWLDRYSSQMRVNP